MPKDKEIRIKVKGPEDEATAETPDAADPAAAGDASVEEAGSSDASEASVEIPETDQLKRRVAELEDRLLRTAAEFDNYRKRTARQFDEIGLTAQDKVLVELLEVVDNFERALQHSHDDVDVKSVRQGMDLIYAQMRDLLKRHGVEAIGAVGKPFDPNLHEALLQVASAEHPAGTVAMEMTRGYMHGDRVLRHARVAVSSGASETAPGAEPSGSDQT